MLKSKHNYMKEKVKANSSILKFNWDFLGFFASFLCAIHCVLLPLILAVFPVLGVGLSHNHELENVLILGSLIIAVISLGLGFKNQHGNLMPLALFALSVVIFANSYFLDHHSFFGEMLHFAGGAMLLVSHILNFYCIRGSRQDQCKSLFHFYH